MTASGALDWTEQRPPCEVHKAFGDIRAGHVLSEKSFIGAHPIVS